MPEPLPTDHRTAAEHFTAELHTDNPTPTVLGYLTALHQRANAHALLAITAHLGELVEQRKLTNVLTAVQAGILTEDHWLELGYDDKAAVGEYVRARIGDIVNPRPESETD
jgi:hypothetical protein